MRACPAPPAGFASCHALVRTDGQPVSKPGGKPAPPPSAPTRGLFPADLQTAYQLSALTGGTGTGHAIAIVDAFDAPNVVDDLAFYRHSFGLPVMSTCVVGISSVTAPDGSPCFAKLNQSGGQKYPRANGGWAQEISLDVDMASAICPLCNIVLVEADSNSFANLGAAENYAATLHPDAISNSYGGGDASDSTYGAYYNHARIAITVSSGDNGYGVEYPASSQYVTAVGGTTLPYSKDTSGTTFSAETAWSGAGSGCAAYNTQPAWQASNAVISGVCPKRAVADVAAVADPATGVAVYDSYAYQGLSGWLVFGGTSVAAPIIAGVYALAGNAGAVTYPSSLPYSAPPGSLHDVSAGSNGSCGTVLCNAGSDWDGPTGLGTPIGVGAF